MAQFFNRKEAENFRSDVIEHFPQLRVDHVLDVPNKETGEYERSFVSISFWDGTELLASININSEENWNGLLLFSRYITRTIEDNQQSEAYDHSLAEKAMVKYADWKNLSQQERFEQHGNVEI